MKAFDRLARTVAAAWRRAGNRLDAFPGIATRTLSAFSCDFSGSRLDADVGRWLLETPALPEQVNLHNTFGQPSVTLFHGGGFVVDLYFWLTFDTSIHSHGFRGAFRVLHGRSLHEVFPVTTSKAVAPDVALVRLGRPEATLMGPGDVRTIQPGQELVHRVVHLENPTVTLCVKTIDEARITQWKYFPNGLAIRMRRIPPDLIKKIYYVQYLLEQDPPRASAMLDRVLRGLDRSTCMNLYGAIAAGSYDLSERAALHFASRLRRLHGKTGWFRRYEALDRPVRELHFDACDDPLDRLVAHLVNADYDPRTVRSLLAGRPVREIEDVVAGLLRFDHIFGEDLSMDDRDSIRALIAEPGRAIPGYLRAFKQIGKLRSFLRAYARLD